MLGQRLGEMLGHAPTIEEDLGLANTSLDLIGQARLLLAYAGELEGQGRSEDQLAFLRTEREFRNLVLAEQPNGDFAHTIVRQFLVDAYQLALYERLQNSSDRRLGAIAAKSLKETQYHLRYSSGWLLRLGDGTEESHGRAQRRSISFGPSREMFDEQEGDRVLVRLGVAPVLGEVEADWLARIDGVLREATLGNRSPCRIVVRPPRRTSSTWVTCSPICNICSALSGCAMVANAVAQEAAESLAWAALRAVNDPEIPVLSVVDLGLIRHVHCGGSGAVEVGLAPTYSGCPATAVIRLAVVTALRAAGFAQPTVTEVLSPPWSSDWLSSEGRLKLQRYGIAPPEQAVDSPRAPWMDGVGVHCPRCARRIPRSLVVLAPRPARRCIAARRVSTF